MGTKFSWDVDPETEAQYTPEELAAMQSIALSHGFDPGANLTPYSPTNGYPMANPLAGSVPPTSSYDTLISDSQAKLDAQRAELDALQQKVSTPRDRAMSRDEGIASALMSLLPIGIGALVKGKEGAYIGSQAALQSLNAFDKNMDERDKEQRALDLFNYQQASKRYDSVEDILQKAQLGDAQGENTLENTRLRYELDPENQPLSEEMQRVYGVKTWKELKAKQKEIDQNQRERGLGLQETAEERRKTTTAATLAKAQLPYIGWVGKVPSDKDLEKAKKLEETTSLMNGLQLELADSIQANGYQLEGDVAADQRRLASRIIDAYKQAKGYGANFTAYEIKLAESATSTPTSFLSYLRDNGVLGRDMAEAARRSAALNDRQKLISLASIGAFHKNQPYSGLTTTDQRLIRQAGIDFDDKTGRVRSDDFNTQFIDSAVKAAGFEAPTRLGSEPSQESSQQSNPQAARFVQTKKGIWDTKQGKYVSSEEAAAINGR